ncbi:hypothetical protein [Nocardia camponoti]|uniref:Uncharacterized protein n=1 Tax=Nocardia camponoti TaxID=1616106 RepID=A0A917VBV5_9NOCA|nr:hypothetical protein [Nocardia camponoti]GGK60941.1 hypothetical protein GCM10011591_36680 [Nocardia camponoti]
MYVYTNLSAALRDKKSPLREYLDQRFPDVRPIQAEFRRGSGPLLVDSATVNPANPATLGSAFDFLVRFLLVPNHAPVIALLGFFGHPHELAVIEDVIGVASASAAASADSEDVDRLSRACWALALCTDVYRRGLLRDSALASLLEAGRFDPASLLSLAPPDAIRQLWELRGVADQHFLPKLRPPFYPGPTFDASKLVNADADLIADGLLIDIKTHLGAKNARTGLRSDSLSTVDLYQVITYALFDHSDTYRINEVGIYSARYGYLASWGLSELLSRLSGGAEIDVAREREVVWRLLGGT